MNKLLYMFKQAMLIFILSSSTTNLVAQVNEYFEIQGIAAEMNDSTASSPLLMLCVGSAGNVTNNFVSHNVIRGAKLVGEPMR